MDKKKKIGLITLPLLDNYGGIIQISALYHFLDSKGFETYLIDKKYNLSAQKVLLKKILANNPFYKIYDVRNYTHRRKHLIYIKKFIDRIFVNKTKEVFDINQLKNLTKDFEAIIVGSDQVWRYEYVTRDLEVYFLNFTEKNQKRISYAASFGVDSWVGDKESQRKVKSYLKNFDSISVREDSGVTICHDIFEVDAVHVIDPTLLVDVSFYNKIIDFEKHDKKIEIFNYVLDQTSSKKELIEKISENLNKKIDVIDLQENIKSGIPKTSISEWLYHFKSADYIITDSFHGTVFSIIFNKQFIAIANKGRGVTRFVSLLKQLGLESRLIFEDDFQDIDQMISQKIDYSVVNSKLQDLKKKSSDFLLNNI